MLSNDNKRGPVHRFKDQLLWAEEGMVCIEDQRDGDFKVLSRAEAAARAIAFNEEVRYMNAHPSDRDEMLRMVVALASCVKEAKTQGDPENPEVRKHKIKAAKKTTMITGPSATPGLDNSLILPFFKEN